MDLQAIDLGGLAQTEKDPRIVSGEIAAAAIDGADEATRADAGDEAGADGVAIGPTTLKLDDEMAPFAG